MYASRNASLLADDCETRIQKLDTSNAGGEERLAAKNEVIESCASQPTK